MEAIFYARPCVFSEGLDGEVQAACEVHTPKYFFSQINIFFLKLNFTIILSLKKLMFLNVAI